MIREPYWDKKGGPELSPLWLLVLFLFLNFLGLVTLVLSMYGLFHVFLFLMALIHKKAPMAHIEEVNVSLFRFPFTMAWLIGALFMLISGLTHPFHTAFGFVEVDEEKRTIKKYLQIKNKRYLVKTVFLSDVIEVIVSHPMSRMWGRRSIIIFYRRGESISGLKNMVVVQIAKDPLNSKLWKYMEENGVRLRIA